MEAASDYRTVHELSPSLREEYVGPRLAREWLDASASFVNRAVRPRIVEQYADQIARRQWRMTGDPIRLDVQGRVLDGQHRLHAIIKADAPIPVVVMRNCPTDLVNYVDIGTPRRGPDFLRMMGARNNPNVTAGALNWLHRYWTDRMSQASVAMPRNEIAAAYEANAGIDASVALALTMRDICGRSSLLAGAHYLFTTIAGRDEADAFMIRVREGDGLMADDPEFQLRKRLLETRRGVRASDSVISAYLIKAWNARREKRCTKVIKWAANEEFPVAI